MADNFAKPFLTAEWRYLVMLNYEIEPAILLPLVPKGTELYTWNGKTFASMVGFLQFASALNTQPSSAFLAEGSEITVCKSRKIT